MVEVGGPVKAIAPEQAVVALDAGLEDPLPQVEGLLLLECSIIAPEWEIMDRELARFKVCK